MTSITKTRPTFDLTPTTEAQRVAFSRLQPSLPIGYKSYDEPQAETIDCIKVITGMNQANAEILEKVLRHSTEQILYDIDPDDLQQVRHQIYHEFNENLSMDGARFDQKGQSSKLAMSLAVLSEYMQFHLDRINRELAEFVISVDEIGTMTVLREDALEIYQ
jgi:hypothetical protein